MKRTGQKAYGFLKAVAVYLLSQAVLKHKKRGNRK